MEEPEFLQRSPAVSLQPSAVATPPATPQSAAGRSTCAACGSTSATALPLSSSHILTVGAVTAAFPSMSIEKEFAQVLSRSDFKGMTDRQTMHAVLSKPEDRYLARRICWQFTVRGGGSSPTYVLLPEDQSDFALLIDTLRRSPNHLEVDVVAGTLAGIAPPAMCNAQQLPIVRFHQLYSFAADAMVKSIPRKGQKTPDSGFEAAGEELFVRLMDMAGNGVGLTRALTYAALHYAGLYELVASKFSENSALTHIHVKQSLLVSDRADIHLKFAKRDTGFSENYCFGVNVEGPFPFLEEPLHPCYEA